MTRWSWAGSWAVGAALITGAALPAGAEAPAWAGYWAEEPSYCARAGEPGEETPEYIAPDGIFGLEYSCDIKSVKPLGVGKSWRVAMVCMDAGFEDRLTELFILTQDDKLLRVSADGYWTMSHRCKKGIDE